MLWNPVAAKSFLKPLMFMKWRTCVHEVTGLAVEALVQRAEELRVVPGEIAATRTTADHQQPLEHYASRSRAHASYRGARCSSCASLL